MLREVVGAHRAAPTRSELERRFLDLCSAHHLPMPKVNVWVAGVEADFYWLRLVSETYAKGDPREQAAVRDYFLTTPIALAGLGWLAVGYRLLNKSGPTHAA